MTMQLLTYITPVSHGEVGRDHFLTLSTILHHHHHHHHHHQPIYFPTAGAQAFLITHKENGP
jgi:hypothetical protein